MSSAPLVKLSIDGREVEAEKGRTILEVARAHDIEIPTLCHDPRLKPYGACLLCVVEVEGARKLLLSCATQIAPGMVVRTDTPAIRSARRRVLELVLSSHPADCRAPCAERCPAGVDARGYIALARAGACDEALALIRESNPFPSVCGRICVRYCESECRRRQVDEPVAINVVKRYLADLEGGRLPPPERAAPNGHRVAVVGGGPAGMTAAFFLSRRGYAVTVFDAHEKLGGTLRYGIPDYRLPQAILDREIAHVLDGGVEARTGERLGTDFTLESLRQDGFEAVCLALGAMRAKPLGVPGEGAAGVIGGIDFLAAAKRAEPPALKGRVVVVGGGNTAVDAARTALRLGASKVSLLYRRSRAEMPADPGEVEDAEAEGVTLDLLVAPVEVLSEGGAVKALRCQRMRLGEPDASGRCRPIPIEGALCDYACNTIVAAIGQDVDLHGVGASAPGTKLALAANKAIAVDGTSMATSLEGVFAAGDAVTGPAAAVDAIGAGHRAADAIDRYLRPGAPPPRAAESASRRQRLVPPGTEGLAEVARASRIETSKLPAEERVGGFAEVEATPERDAVARETARCLSCGCTAALRCELKRWAERYGAQQARFSGRVKRHRVDCRHPYVSLDPAKCILCGKCIRLCSDLIDVAALGLVHRGFETVVRPSLERPLAETNCISCGNCIEACPTGALDFRFAADSAGPWRAVPSPSVCDGCGVGCGLVVHSAGGRASFVTAGSDGNGAKGELCVRGRFGQSYLAAEERLRQPRVREEGGTRAVTVAEAVREAGRRLSRIAERHGPGAVAFLVSPRATNEEMFLVERLARRAFRTNNVGSLHALGRDRPGEDPEESVGLVASTLPAEQLDLASVVVTVNADPVADNPVLGFRLKRAVRRGARLFAVAADESRTAAVATARLPARRGTSTLLLGAVAAEIVRAGRVATGFVAGRTRGFDQLAQALRALGDVQARTGVAPALVRDLAEAVADPHRKVVFLYDADSVRERAHDDLRAILNLLLLTGKIGTPGNGLLLLRETGNGQGLVDMGARPEAATRDDLGILGGSRSSAELITLLRAGAIRGLFVLGEDLSGDASLAPLLESTEVLVAVDALETGTTRAAHVCWPAAPVLESAGTVTAADRRVRSFAPALRPAAPGAGLAALAGLHAALTGETPPAIDEIRGAMAGRHPAYAPVAALEIGSSFHWNDTSAGGEILFGERFATSDGLAHLRAPVLEPSLLARRAATYSAVDAWRDRERARLFGARGAAVPEAKAEATPAEASARGSG